jgi:anti-anti-sigma factor
MNLNEIIQIEEKDNYFLFNLIGKFVGDEETDLLKNELEKIAKSKKNNVILNFEYVLYFSSIALGILVKEDEYFSTKDGKLLICNVPSFLNNIFELTKLSSVLNIFKTLGEAERFLTRN